MKTMIARYRGTCVCCGKLISRGQQILYSRETGAMHACCYAGQQPDNASAYVQAQEDAYWDNLGRDIGA